MRRIMKYYLSLIICCLILFLAFEGRAQTFSLGWFDRINPYGNPADLAAGGANYVIAYRLEPDYEINMEAYLKEAAKQRLQVVLDLRDIVANLHNGSEWQNKLTAIAITYGQHAALAGWFIAEKPYLNPQYPLANCQIAHTILKQHSDRPIYIVFDRNDLGVNNPTNYAAVYDVMMADLGMTVQGQAEFTGFSSWKYATIQARQQAAALGKPLHSVVPAVGQVSGMEWNYRLTTLSEQRFMVYYSILAGEVGGVAFWARHYLMESIATPDAYIYDGPQWFKDVGLPIGLEMQSYRRALANGPIAGGVEDHHTDIISRVYQDPQTRKYYLLSLNTASGEAADVHFTLNLPTLFKHAAAMAGNGSQIAITNNAFEDSFKGYHVANYELLPAVRSCQDIIDEGCGIVGDLDLDCYMSVADIAIFADSWLQCSDPANQACQN